MEIRPLQIDDLFTIARMLGKARAKSKKSTSPKEAWRLLTDEPADDFLAWLADLAGKEVEEFGAMPTAVIFDIVAELAQQEGFQDFLLWTGILCQPGGHEKLVKVCLFLHRKYGLAADGKTPFSRFAQVLREVVRSRWKEVNDTLVEAEEILALAREKGK